MTDREWTWIAALAAIAGTAYSGSGWLGIISLAIIWYLLGS